ncbi:ATP-binding protein [Streptomyces sp. NPDC049099]|uniref:ATP-binding protein n=1 Tax=Streptomyces sp. NPDC049099 TaxID=3155768 RepID=UPI003426D189
MRLPAVLPRRRPTDDPARIPPPDSTRYARRDLADAEQTHRARSITDPAHRLPDPPDGPHRTPGTAVRPQQPRDGADATDRTPDTADRRPRRGPDRTDGPDRRADAALAAPRGAPDTGNHPLPAADAVEPPHRPVPAGVRRPPGGERLGRLPGPLGPDRLASRAPTSRCAAAFDLPARPAAVGAARRVVQDLLTAWDVPEDRRDDAVLVISELVTNALMHTAGRRIACRLHDMADRIRIEVEDQEGGAAPPVARRPGPDDQHGRGLLLVDALSLAWGVTPLSGRPARVVWAELPSDHG